MDIALIGLGSVGRGLLTILRDKADDLRARYGFAPRITAAATRTRGSLVCPDGLDAAALLRALEQGGLNHYAAAPGLLRGWDAARIAREAQAHVFVEATPSDFQTGQPALDVCKLAFAAGKHVVLANKGPVAVAYGALADAARAAGRLLRFEATVMGGTPSIRLAMQALAGCTIHEVRGILNGTTNFILTQMERGHTYGDALADAQRLGYAETDPTADVDGWDAAGKAAILGTLLFGKPFSVGAMQVHGIRGITRENVVSALEEGERWKLVAHLTPDGATVGPVRLPLSAPLASVQGITNAVTYSTDLLGDVTLVGPGAGGVQTGFALLSDLLDIHGRVVSLDRVGRIVTQNS